MTNAYFPDVRKAAALCGLLFLLQATGVALAEPSRAAATDFDAYCGAVESRLARQHRSAGNFLVNAGFDRKMGEVQIERVREGMTPPVGPELPGALLHHWRGTAFAPGARAADFERLMREFDAYPKYFSPQVTQAGVLRRDGDRMQAWMRVRQHHVITVVMDSTYDILFGRLDVRHGYSISRSARISEIDGAGTRAERVLSASEEHGFLWRLNTYWSYEERDGGLYLQVEAVSLTRSIPSGLGWVVRPFVESIPRESLEFTLRSAVGALRR